MGWRDWFRRGRLEAGDGVTSPFGNWEVISIEHDQAWLRPASANKVQAIVVVPVSAFQLRAIWLVPEHPMLVAIMKAERGQDVPHRRR